MIGLRFCIDLATRMIRCRLLDCSRQSRNGKTARVPARSFPEQWNTKLHTKCEGKQNVGLINIFQLRYCACV